MSGRGPERTSGRAGERATPTRDAGTRGRGDAGRRSDPLVRPESRGAGEDRGRNWSALALLLGLFLILLGAGGMRQSFGVFIHPLEQAFDGDRAQVALVASVTYLVFGLIQPLAGWAVDRFGPSILVPGAIALSAVGAIAASMSSALWQVGLFYGLIAAAGFGAVANAPLAGIVARHFSTRRTLALGVCGMGTPLGQLMFAPLLALIITQYDWRAAMGVIAGGLLLVVLPVSVLFLRKEPPPGVGAQGGGVHAYRGIRATLATRSYQLLVGAYVICGATTLGLIHTHLIPYSLSLGMTQVEGARALGLLGMANMLGLLAAGVAGDRWGARLPLAAVYGLRGLTLLWLGLDGSPEMLILFVLAFGLVDMATIPLTGAMTATLFGRQAVGALYGLAVVGHQVGSALGAWLGGIGFVTFGTYQPVFLAGAGLALAASVMSLSLEQRTRPRLAPAG